MYLIYKLLLTIQVSLGNISQHYYINNMISKGV